MTASPSPEAVISESALPAPLAYVEAFHPEDDALTAGRQRGAEVGAVPIGAGGGATLTLLARLLDARAVVEIGTGCGVSGVYLARGMAEDGTLTSIDPEAEHQRLARLTFTEAGIAANRLRLITGRALEVLPRLADGGYDLVFADAEKNEYVDYLTEAVRLLRPGGVVAFDNALWHGRVPDPSARDERTVAVRELGRTVREHPRLTSMLLPVGDGLLVAVLRD